MEPIAQAIPRAIASLLKETPLSPGKVDFAWKTSVGPAMGRGTSARLEGQVLVVSAPSAAWAREIRRSSKIIMGRMQTMLGPEIIRALEVRG